MQSLSQVEGTYVDVDGRYVIVVGRFNHHVVDSLVEGAVDSLVRHGVDMEHIDIVHVPGAWELPLAVKRVLNVVKPDAVIALGAVIRGGTRILSMWRAAATPPSISCNSSSKRRLPTAC